MEFPPTLYINLKTRTDRRKMIEDNFSDWPVKIQRVAGIKNKIGWKGCTLSHRKCIEIANKRKYPWVLVLEDDCKLQPDGLANFLKLLPILWEKRNEFDIFLGGSAWFEPVKMISDGPPSIVSVFSGVLAHFCLIPQHVYHHILEDIRDRDPVVVIDNYYPNNFRVWTSLPFIANQKLTRSDIQKKDSKTMKIFREYENLLSKFVKKHTRRGRGRGKDHLSKTRKIKK